MPVAPKIVTLPAFSNHDEMLTAVYMPWERTFMQALAAEAADEVLFLHELKARFDAIMVEPS